jgi:branched-subunit amino acid aminotransferase/4-amino-4-deoxychorismate lyase
VNAGILPGVTRGVILELATEQGLPVDERPLPLAELREVDEFFLTGAGKCLVAADVLDGRTLPAPRPVSSALHAALVRRIARECGVPEASVRF